MVDISAFVDERLSVLPIATIFPPDPGCTVRLSRLSIRPSMSVMTYPPEPKVVIGAPWPSNSRNEKSLSLATPPTRNTPDDARVRVYGNSHQVDVGDHVKTVVPPEPKLVLYVPSMWKSASFHPAVVPTVPSPAAMMSPLFVAMMTV